MVQGKESRRFLIGIDDTDNLESRGTGYHARQLGLRLALLGFAQVKGITRHQLFVDPRIPYTSHNSSLCLDVNATAHQLGELAECCREYLRRESASGSDAGLCIAAWDAVDGKVEDFGRRAKSEVMARHAARHMAERFDYILEGLTGDHGGIIGALAAVGLRRSDNDGRFVWRPGVRELSGVVQVEKLLRDTGINVVRSLSGIIVRPEDKVDVSPWPRPVLLDGQAVLLVEKVGEANVDFEWRLAPKSVVKHY